MEKRRITNEVQGSVEATESLMPSVMHPWAPEGRDLLGGGHAPQQHEAIPLELRAHLSAKGRQSHSHMSVTVLYSTQQHYCSSTSTLRQHCCSTAATLHQHSISSTTAAARCTTKQLRPCWWCMYIH
jgi:hypothetical protein